MNTDKPRFFSLEFRGVHGTRVFESIEDLDRWLAQEEDAFRELKAAKLLKNEEPLSGLLSRIQGVCTAREHLSQAMNCLERQELQQYEAALNQVRKRLNGAYVDRGIPPGQSLEVQALKPYAERDPTASLAALHCFCEPTPGPLVATLNLGEAAVARGLGLASFIRYELFGQTPDGPATQVVATTIASLNERADRVHSALSQRLAEASEVTGRLKQAWEARDTEFAKLSSKLSDDVDTAISDAKVAVDSFKNSYQAEIALKEPVTFWTNKATSHANSARSYGIAALVVAIVAGVAAVSCLPGILKAGQSAVVPYYGIAVAVAVSTLTLWLLRVLVRNYLAQNHLKTDADERVAMVKTYLALMESGKAPTESLGPVLSALFRPATDGLVKSDSMPLSVAEILTRSSK